MTPPLPSALQFILVAALAPVSDQEIAQALSEIAQPVATVDDRFDQVAMKALIEARRRAAWKEHCS